MATEVKTKVNTKLKNIGGYFNYTKKQEDEILDAYKNSKRSRKFKNAKELIKYLRSK